MALLGVILVAIDGSGMANHALTFACRLARQFDSDLIFCTALDYASSIDSGATPQTAYQTVPVVYEEYERAAKILLGDAALRATAAGVRSSTMLLEGRPIPAILAAAKLRNVAAIVMGTKGKRDIELMLLGSCAEGVLRLADVPTFVVNQSQSEAGATSAPAASKAVERVLVALDDSDPAAGAFDFALALTEAVGSVVCCCSVVPTGQLIDNAAIYGCDPAPYVSEARQTALARLDAATTLATKRGRQIERVILEGDASDAILVAAVERHADLIVCGSHGRRGLHRLVMGSVAESLVRRSSVPVAVVRMRHA